MFGEDFVIQTGLPLLGMECVLYSTLAEFEA